MKRTITLANVNEGFNYDLFFITNSQSASTAIYSAMYIQ